MPAWRSQRYRAPDGEGVGTGRQAGRLDRTAVAGGWKKGPLLGEDRPDLEAETQWTDRNRTD